jgi:putative ABC transport system ATP-binding protein
VVVAPLLAARGLTAVRAIDGRDVRVLDGVDLKLAPGDIAELRGPSGAGKTTLLLAIARLLPGAGGSLALAGESADATDPAVWRTKVALLPQRTALFPGTVEENLLLPFALKSRDGATPPSAEALRAALDDVGLSDVALDRDTARLSVGQAARVALLRVLLTAPRVLLLDEPDASLDDASAAAVAAMTARFAEAGGAVLRVSHLRADAAATVRLHLEGGRLGGGDRDDR